MTDVKTEYALAVEEFERADAAYKALQQWVESGAFLEDMFKKFGDNYLAAQAMWAHVWGQLKELLDTRNARVKNVKDALRRSVQLSATEERGPDGVAHIVKCGEFVVSSVTHRSFDAPSLFSLAQKFGVYDEVRSLTYIDKNGQDQRAVREVYEIEYPVVLKFLREKNLQEVIDGSYDERDKTPMVKGPKELGFLGSKTGD